ncbi:MAG TPA: SpoIIE family protein phosphatase [Terriglobales bacterium]|jgi:sigma-B regulation protein RsbU (phosphoserine phosphatase)|nr:SpoIIE family protein phosphatase [Terriglobales bacterium]
MALPYRYLRFRLRLSEAGLLPTSKLAFITWYMLGLDVLLFGLQQALAFSKPSFARNLGGWVSFLSFVVAILFIVLAIRWIKAKMLWRLRNRLIVTYVFFGLIPVVLLVALAIGSYYLFAGQLATFIVTTRLNTELQSLDAANSMIAHEIRAKMQHGGIPEVDAIEGLRLSEKSWNVRHVQVWLDGKVILNSSPVGTTAFSSTLPAHMRNPFREVVRNNERLFLRVVKTVPVNGKELTVLTSEALDQRLLQEFAGDLGELTLFKGITLRKASQSPGNADTTRDNSGPASNADSGLLLDNACGKTNVLDTLKATPAYSAGIVPPPTSSLDHTISFGTSVCVVDWQTGDTMNPVGVTVQTRVSKLYEQLFGALGDLAPAIESSLLVLAIIFGVIELLALYIGTRLTRTVTGAVAQIYVATQHINRGDFSHRIPIRSSDQLSALANSFNSMTASMEQLIEEQKQKQRLENELAIAQEVQEQLYPRHISQLASLEVFGFCRPARTVSGDYYDFLKLDSEKLLLAVGDISGKGISAALLMATIHSAVRAYSLEGIPILREAVSMGAGLGSGNMLGVRRTGTEVSPSNLLALLNHQLYESTPMEKYATLFLGVYDGEDRKFTYSNGGHLPPIVLAEDGSLRRLESGGTVVGLFDNCSYEESSVQLRRGEIFLAYSDGVTEPENDFGEFGEERLIELVQENRDLPLAKISEIVTAAVDDWIGANEQPDDVTLVLARAR